jgi:hypothetical protein
MSTLGTVAAIWRYPVKSMMGEELNACAVTAGGVAGDRAYAFIDGDNRIATAKIQRRWRPVFQSRARYLAEPDGVDVTPAEITLPDGSRLMTSEPGLEATFARLLGFEARLVTEKWAPLKLESPPFDRPFETEAGSTVDFPVVNGFFDLGSLHLLTTATLDTLRSLNPASRYEPRRFRLNFVIATGDATGFVENDWPGKTLEIGDDVRIKVMMPTLRCLVTTLPQDDLPNEPDVLKTAAAHNNANVGVYALVEQGGWVRRGDAVRVA